MRVVAVVPAYNEGARLGEVVGALLARVDRVVVVDDGSMDDTAARAQAAGATVLRHALNRGQGAALKTGTTFALADGADIVVHYDADGQHDPASLGALIAPIASGEADVVYGSRFLGIKAEGMPFTRQVVLFLARQFSALVLGIPRRITDPQSGLRAMSRAAAVSLDFRQDRMAHCSELLCLVARSRWRVKEIPVRVSYSPETLAKGQFRGGAWRIVWQLLLGSFQR
ncbi:MAG: glycosyltransferase family 2 protein [Patescibacteria group bacterium]|nr:glycosyltransferase family 2 protein [Patescibacteria group bacterium]